jgi:uncharacterized protein (TIRG00374 family)
MFKIGGKYNFILLATSLILLVVLLIYSNFFEVLSILSKANLTFIPLAYFLWFASLLLRSLRWKFLLKKVGMKVKFWKVAKVYAIGMFISNLTPLKTGEPIRSVFLKIMDGKNISSSLPSIFIEKIFDVTVLILFSIFGLAFLGLSKFSFWLILAILVYVLAFGIGTYILISKERVKKFFERIVKLFSFLKFMKKFEKKVESFSIGLHEAFVKYNTPRMLGAAFAYSLAIWIVEGTILFMSFLMLDTYVNPFLVIAVWAISILVGVITFLPGGLGSSEGVSMLIFTTFLSISPAKVLAAAILARIFSYWNYILVGIVLLNLSKIKFKI